MPKIEEKMNKERETEAIERIFLAIKEWRDEEGGRIVNNLESCEDLTNKLFNHLKARGLLKLEDDGD
jgi:hypothetical protein